MIKALAAAGMILAALPISSASAATRPPENAECPAIVHTIRHYLPALANRADDFRAFYAVDDYINPFTLHYLNRWVGEVGGAFEFYSIGVNGASPMRQGLAHIKVLCPKASPASW